MSEKNIKFGENKLFKMEDIDIYKILVSRKTSY